MFKNSVFRVSVDTKKWAKASAKRAVVAFATTFVSCIGGASTIGQVNWQTVISSASLSLIVSVGLSVAGLPEVKAESEEK